MLTGRLGMTPASSRDEGLFPRTCFMKRRQLTWVEDTVITLILWLSLLWGESSRNGKGNAVWLRRRKDAT